MTLPVNVYGLKIGLSANWDVFTYPKKNLFTLDKRSVQSLKTLFEYETI